MAAVQKRLLGDLICDQTHLQCNFIASNQCGSSTEASILPKGFPASLSESLAWDGSQLDSNLTNVYSLTAADAIELDAALATFKGRISLTYFSFTELGSNTRVAYELDGDLVDNNNFPLPNLQHILNTSRNELHSGKGFFVLRGLNPSKYSVEDSTIIFLGIQSYIAERKARQDDKGNMIGETSDSSCSLWFVDSWSVHIISDASATSTSTKVFHSRHSKSSIVGTMHLHIFDWIC